MSERVLSLRELNRATLDRQYLLARQQMSATDVIERLVGMQSQVAWPPYVGLWSRIQGFEREELSALYRERKFVRATMMRTTLHLLSSRDYLHFRTTMQPALAAAGESIVKQRGEIDAPAVVEFARGLLAEKPRTFAELSELMAAKWPDTDPGSMRYTVRTTLRLVQVPNDTPWSFPATPAFTLADDYLGEVADPAEHLEDLVRRYLAAFGPATVRDAQAWCGLDLKPAFDALRPELVTYRDEKKRELFDLPGIDLPDAETEVPVRLLPEFDNLLLSHQDRRRVVPDAVRKGVFLPALRVAATILADGIVAGAWKVERSKSSATLTLTPFRDFTAIERDAAATEAEALLAFMEPAATERAIRFRGRFVNRRCLVSGTGLYNERRDAYISRIEPRSRPSPRASKFTNGATPFLWPFTPRHRQFSKAWPPLVSLPASMRSTR